MEGRWNCLLISSSSTLLKHVEFLADLAEEQKRGEMWRKRGEISALGRRVALGERGNWEEWREDAPYLLGEGEIGR